jgi:hypothetical protein
MSNVTHLLNCVTLKHLAVKFLVLPFSPSPLTFSVLDPNILPATSSRNFRVCVFSGQTTQPDPQGSNEIHLVKFILQQLHFPYTVFFCWNLQPPSVLWPRHVSFSFLSPIITVTGTNHGNHIRTLYQRFPNCAPRATWDPRAVPNGMGVCMSVMATLKSDVLLN